MDKEMNAMEKLGKMVAGAFGDGHDQKAADAEEAAILDAAPSTGRSGHARWIAASLAAAALVAMVAGGAFFLSGHGTMRYRVAGVAHDGKEGVWLQEKADIPLELAFDDGSRIVMQKTARGRVMKATRDAVSIALDSGTLSAEVKSAGRTRWDVDAGPYRVTVTGTVFDVSWQPADGLLDVRVREGKVKVSGAGLTEDGISLDKGHVLHRDEKRGRTVMSTESPPAIAPVPVPWPGSIPGTALPEPTEARHARDSNTSPVAVMQKHQHEGRRTAAPSEAPRPSSPAVSRQHVEKPIVTAGEISPAPPAMAPPHATISQPLAQPAPLPPVGSAGGKMVETEADPSPQKKVAVAARPEWKELYTQARYGEALAAAEREGFDGLLLTTDLGDLWALADAARMARNPGKAGRALNAVRQRFAGTARARTAAYFLGKVSMDLEGNPTEASRWFEIYGREDPDGRLSEEALGWLIEARTKSSQKAAAKDAARRYLQKYPAGTFSDLAKSVLGE